MTTILRCMSTLLTSYMVSICWYTCYIFFLFLVQIAYGRFSENKQGYRDLDLFIQQKDGKKIVDPEKLGALCSRLKVEMLHPLRVIIANRGPDPELLVANPVELSGNGRPLVFYDVTLALKTLGICIFSVRNSRIKLWSFENSINTFLLWNHKITGGWLMNLQISV